MPAPVRNRRALEAARQMDQFHARNPGATRRAYARGRDPGGRSSYQRLADLSDFGARVLDLGCGDGYLLELLRLRGARAVGVDRSGAELALARRAGHRVVCADAVALPFADASFDLVVSHLAFSVMDELDSVTAEIDRVLTRHGAFAAVVGGGPAAEPSDGFELFLGLLADALAGGPRCRFGDPRSSRLEGWQGLLAGRGFTLQWTRHLIDLSAHFDAVWTTLSSAYDCLWLAPESLASLRQRFAAACQRCFPSGWIPLSMVVWLGVARR